MSDSPTQRTLRECRKRGWIADVTEHWVPSHLTRAVVDSAQRMESCETPFSQAEVIRAVRARKRGLPGQRRDLFGCVDVVALDCDAQQIVGIQACVVGSRMQRWNKIRIECGEAAAAWLRCGGRLEVWGWGAYKVKRGGKAVRWRADALALTLADLEDVIAKPF